MFSGSKFRLNTIGLVAPENGTVEWSEISWLVEKYIHEDLVYIYTQYIYGTVEWNAISSLVEEYIYRYTDIQIFQSEFQQICLSQGVTDMQAYRSQTQRVWDKNVMLVYSVSFGHKYMYFLHIAVGVYCLRSSRSETYKSACPFLPPSLTDWLTPSLWKICWNSDTAATVTHHSLILGLWNFNRASLTTRQLMSGDLTNLFQLLTAEISY